jgi:elongation factor Ts
MVTAQSVKELREMTGAGMMTAKSLPKPMSISKKHFFLREKDWHPLIKNREICAKALSDHIFTWAERWRMVENNIRTDFVAQNSEIPTFVKDIAMQSRINPTYLQEKKLPDA